MLGFGLSVSDSKLGIEGLGLAVRGIAGTLKPNPKP